jgi:serine/threonine-protein kinase RsbW
MKTELHIPSDLKFREVVENWILNTVKIELENPNNWEQLSNRIKLALAEAFSNVVRHAHKEKPDLPVLLRLEIENNHICLEIWDYGQGYDISNYNPPDPCDRQLGGYGWLIINRLIDKVEYNLQVDGRNCLTLEIHLPKLDN